MMAKQPELELEKAVTQVRKFDALVKYGRYSCRLMFANLGKVGERSELRAAIRRVLHNSLNSSSFPDEVFL